MAAHDNSEAEIIEPSSLTFSAPDNKTIVPSAVLDFFKPAEARVVFYRAGSSVPRHRHSGQTLTVVLKGRCDGPNGVELTPGALYKCGGSEYGPWKVTEDTYFLIVQKAGTEFVAQRA